ncbi:MAG TPA: ECF-type sigma factor [Xanthomonadaceae bacterium]
MGENDITRLLARWRTGDKAAEGALMDALYPQLRDLARRQLHGASHRLTLRATELVNESYLKLLDQRTPWENRRHFVAVASSVMRRVLVDLLRERAAEKRGHGIDHIELVPGVEGEPAASEPALDWLVLEQALATLERRDAIAARVVELRYFGGLNNEEVAAELDIGVATVVRHWQFARAWLHKRL